MGTLLSRYQGSILPELSSRLPTIQTEHQGQSLPLLAPKWLVPIPTSIVLSGLIPGRPKVSQLANRLIVQCGMLKIRVTISSVGSVAKQRRWREGKAKGNTKRQMEESSLPTGHRREAREEGPGCEEDNSSHTWHVSLLLLLSWKR